MLCVRVDANRRQHALEPLQENRQSILPDRVALPKPKPATCWLLSGSVSKVQQVRVGP